MWDLTNGKLLRTITDAHPPGSAVLHVKVDELIKSIVYPNCVYLLLNNLCCLLTYFFSNKNLPSFFKCMYMYCYIKQLNVSFLFQK